ncbi:MAG: hypothetical protein QXF46_08895 [Thermofilaceae archaeon]
MNDQRTFRTLLEELGLEKFMNEFSITPSLNTCSDLFNFDHGGLHFTVTYNHRYHTTPVLVVHTHACSSTTEPSNPPVRVEISVKNPRVEDVYKVEKLVKELRSDIELKISRISSWIKRSCRYPLTEENMRVSGSVSVRNYEFDNVLAVGRD